jgi:hypothetical protein
MDQIDAREKWAEITGERVQDVPWEAVFLSDRQLTLEEALRPLLWGDAAQSQ